eukprot:TRINITY_DN8008_c0_g1_i1.p1 TRINITY_DN8008_c0_g1~~TRINITY_DN8008_c0_g1_i1.p1  ORF type:complete len:685 (-),score=242.80 TRINITY_DN8008_c0_g1_i1:57-1994(-)
MKRAFGEHLHLLTENLPELISSVEGQVTELKNEVMVENSKVAVLCKFVGDTRKKHECPLCDRSFSNTKDESSFIQKIEKSIAESPQSLQEQQAKLASSEKRLKKLQGLRPNWEAVKRLEENELRRATTLADLVQRRAAVEAELSSQRNQQLAGLKADCQQLSDLIQRICELVKVSDQISGYERQMQSELSKLKDGQEYFSVEETQNEFAKAQTASEAIKKRIQTGSQEHDRLRHEKDLLLSKKSKFNEEHSVQRSRLDQLKKETESFEKDLIPHKNLLIDQITELKIQREDLDNKIAFLLSDHDEDLVLKRRQEDKLQKTRERFSSDLSLIQSLKNKLSSNGVSVEILSEKASKVKTKIQALEDAVIAAAEEKNNIKRGITETEGELRSGSELIRMVNDNITYRGQKERIKKLKEDISENTKKIQEASIEKIDKEISLVQSSLKSVVSKRDQTTGQCNAWKEQIDRNRKELGKAIYRTVDSEYRDLMIKCGLTQMSIKDLNKYYNALDKALMKFHSVKMEEINKIMNELWQMTYRGTDIDSIKICSDCDNVKLRSYNYRVVMLKGDAELDMRGRCSAGQKVLASLIVRLALAECFCFNCGILALDEPTSNLDRYNTESFASALVEYGNPIPQSRHVDQIFYLFIY